VVVISCAGSVRNVVMHDGSIVALHKVADDYDPTDRDRAYAYIRDRQRSGQVVTGLLFIDSQTRDMHDQNDTVVTPLVDLPHEQLCPGNDELQKLQQRFR
jgi:2-oxoglutarate/2-oxoacid ferredoxin oxidoreductase subunit beta